MANRSPRSRGRRRPRSVAAGAIRRYEERLAKDPLGCLCPSCRRVSQVGRAQEAITLCQQGLSASLSTRRHASSGQGIISTRAMLERRSESSSASWRRARRTRGPSPGRDIHRKAGRWNEAREHLESVVQARAGDREGAAHPGGPPGGGSRGEGCPSAAFSRTTRSRP